MFSNHPDEDSAKPLKIACHSCWQKLDVSHIAPFSKINCPACQAEILVPRKMGSLLLEERLADGNMATVYRALDLTLDREVAVKMLKKAAAGRPGAMDAFLTEAKNVAVINHPNVLPIFSSGNGDDDCPYIVMEFMGANLEQVIREHGTRIGLDAAMFYISEVARGLEAAQGYQIVHHDLKPSNILLNITNNVKVSDFSQSWALRNTGRPVPLEEVVASCRMPLYYSPEKLETGREDFRGDIYSLGAILYHLVTGEAPFYQGDMLISLRSRLSCLARTPSELRPDLPAGLSELVMSMLSLRPEDRPRCYADIVQALDRCRGGQPGVAAVVPAPPILSGLQTHGGRKRFATKSVVRKYSPEGRAKTRRVQAKRKQWNSLINLFIIVNLIVVLLLVFMSARKRQAASPGSSSLPQQQNAAPSYTAPAPPAAPNPGRATTAAPAPVPAPPATMQPSAVDRKLQPPDLDFRSLKAALDEHISRQPADMRSLEKQRIEYISGFREYLSTLITYTPYRTGEDKPLMMPDGRILNGSLGPATKRGINFRPAEAGAAQTEIGWNEIGLDQYMQIFRHYINMREKEKASTTFSTFEVDRQVASDFFRLAIICDWYGRKTEAAEFVRLALRNDTKVAPLVRTMLPAYTQGQTAN